MPFHASSVTAQDLQAKASQHQVWGDFPSLPDIPMPESWDDVQEHMDPLTILVSILVLWALVCALCNLLQCFLDIFCCCCRNRSRSRRRGYTPIGTAAGEPPRYYDNPPPYNPAYYNNASVYDNPPSRVVTHPGNDSRFNNNSCRNMLWALCCLECCCRDNQDFDCCELCCGLCLYETCCPRDDKENNTAVLIV